MALSLEKLKEKRDILKTLISRPDALSQSFYGGMVGFKSGTAKKKWEKSIDRELKQIKELEELEEKIKRLENPYKRTKAIEQDPKEWNIGDKAQDSFNNVVEVLKINKKTITIQYSRGFKESIKPHLLTKINYHGK